MNNNVVSGISSIESLTFDAFSTVCALLRQSLPWTRCCTSIVPYELVQDGSVGTGHLSTGPSDDNGKTCGMWRPDKVDRFVVA